MKQTLPPLTILNAALRILHCAAYTTRNWAHEETATHKQIFDLWEAIHEIPDLLTRWDGANSENELKMYLVEYSQKWKDPDLKSMYENSLNENMKQ